MPQYVVTIIVSALTFLIGLLIGLFYKYSDIGVLKVKVKTLEDSLSTITLVNLVADVRAMKNSVIFTPEFQVKFSTVCSEHDRLREQGAKNQDDIITLQEQIKHAGNQFAVNINKKQE